MKKMKAKTLKKAILQYAMQGKLVKQNPNDEPASILLERIKIEKEQLIKDGKIKKEKTLPPITEDEIPYKLPKGWEWVRLGNIINISSGRFLPSNEMKTKGTIPVYGGNGINGYHNEYLIDKPTLIIGRVGFYCGCVHLSTDKAWVTDNAFITTFSENNININFLKWLLIASDLGKNDNATAQPVVSGKKIYPLVVALPPLAEQERIVEKLEQILPFVEEYGKNEEKLSKLNSTLPNKIKQSILQYAVQSKLVLQNLSDEPASELLIHIKAEREQLLKDGKIKKEKPLPPITKYEIPYELPQGWEWVKLGELGNSNIGLTYSPTDITTSANGIPVLRSSNIQNNKIDLNDLVRVTTEIKNDNLYVQKGDILICARNGSKNLVGKSAIIKALDEPMTFGAFMAIFRSKVNSWIKVYLDSPLFKKTLESVNTVTINQITQSNLKNAIIPLPPLAEQQRIVTKVEELLAVVESLKV